ncbi:MAG: carbohydrate ABC transporter permease [Lachnospiraceae bacterium]|nr:carbohydrate ABC transporter permease [Lachnospiraceae bacterium]
MKKQIDAGKIVTYVILSFFVLLCLYPFVNVIAYSFSDANSVMAGKITLFPKNFQTDAYKQILKQKQIWSSMNISVLVTLTGTLLSLVLTICAAYALSKKELKGRSIITGFILFTMYFGGGIIPTFMVVKGVGLYDSVASLVIPSAMNVFNFIIMQTFFKNIPKELKEAAFMDGANDMTILVKIILPLSIPIIATIGLYYAVSYWNDYFSALLYIQTPEKFSLQLRLRQMLFADQVNNLGNVSTDTAMVKVMPETLKMACIVLTTLPIVVLYPFLQKYFVKGTMVGAVKG